MITAVSVQLWLDSYLAAWASNSADDLAALFSEHATYRGAPHHRGASGRRAIAAYWRAHRDDPGTWTARLAPLIIAHPYAVISGEVDYTNGVGLFSNLWVLRFADDHQCADFTEWWMKRPSA